MDLVTFTEETLNGKLHFLCVISSMRHRRFYKKNTHPLHCLKSVCIRSYSGPHFPAFGLNIERYSVSPYSVRMRKNMDQNNFEYKHLLRNVYNILRHRYFSSKYNNLSKYKYYCLTR